MSNNILENSQKEIYFSFDVLPIAKQSARFRCVNNRLFSYQNKKVKEYERSIERQARKFLHKDFKMWTKGVRIEQFIFIFPLLKSISKKKAKEVQDGNTIIYKTTKPDLDSNLTKPVIDALEGLVYKNDSQIFQINGLSKMYGVRPRILLHIRVEEK